MLLYLEPAYAAADGGGEAHRRAESAVPWWSPISQCRRRQWSRVKLQESRVLQAGVSILLHHRRHFASSHSGRTLRTCFERGRCIDGVASCGAGTSVLTFSPYLVAAEPAGHRARRRRRECMCARIKWCCGAGGRRDGCALLCVEQQRGRKADCTCTCCTAALRRLSVHEPAYDHDRRRVQPRVPDSRSGSPAAQHSTDNACDPQRATGPRPPPPQRANAKRTGVVRRHATTEKVGLGCRA